MTITTADKIREIKRELGMRERVYPLFVKAGRLKQEAADRQIAVLQAILDDYEAKHDGVGLRA